MASPTDPFGAAGTASPSSLLELAGVPLEQPRPPNQAVLDQIAGMRQQWQQDVNSYAGNGLLQYGPFSPGGAWGVVAANPELSGYFDLQPGGLLAPHIDPPQQVGSETGQSFGQLASSILPGGSSNGQIRYGVRNDRGGFFTLNDLFAPRGGVPSMGAAGMSGPSTNNWRLLGMGPGWIMRNGMPIYMNSAEAGRGAYLGADMGNPAPGDAGGMALYGRSDVGSGAAYGFPNNWRGAFGWPGQVQPYQYDRPQGTMQG